MAAHVSAPLPDLDLASYVTLTVDAGYPGAVITSFVIHVAQDVPALPLDIKLLPPLLAHEAPGLDTGK